MNDRGRLPGISQRIKVILEIMKGKQIVIREEGNIVYCDLFDSLCGTSCRYRDVCQSRAQQ